MRSVSNSTTTPDAAPVKWIKSGEQVVVTLGRNVGTEPVSDSCWNARQEVVWANILELLKPPADRVFGPFIGEGSWTDETTGEFFVEESAVFIVIAGYTEREDVVVDRFAKLAELYEQDAIAVSHGPNLLARRAKQNV